MFDYNKLKGKIIECGYTIRDIATLLNLPKTSIYERLNRNVPFRDYEIYKIAKFLNIPKNNLDEYFFKLKFDKWNKRAENGTTTNSYF